MEHPTCPTCGHPVFKSVKHECWPLFKVVSGDCGSKGTSIRAVSHSHAAEMFVEQWVTKRHYKPPKEGVRVRVFAEGQDDEHSQLFLVVPEVTVEYYAERIE